MSVLLNSDFPNSSKSEQLSFKIHDRTKSFGYFFQTFKKEKVTVVFNGEYVSSKVLKRIIENFADISHTAKYNSKKSSLREFYLTNSEAIIKVKSIHDNIFTFSSKKKKFTDGNFKEHVTQLISSSITRLQISRYGDDVLRSELADACKECDELKLEKEVVISVVSMVKSVKSKIEGKLHDREVTVNNLQKDYDAAILEQDDVLQTTGEYRDWFKELIPVKNIWTTKIKLLEEENKSSQLNFSKKSKKKN
ncbi:hypothetical protein HDU92_006331 [Lobulomyces angularis]|nr:hypothetical protein HDU92_006331 [Lobulomyces angularis]